MTRWFGESWGAPVCAPRSHAETPLDAACLQCGQPVAEGDRGLLLPATADDPTADGPLHIGCFAGSAWFGPAVRWAKYLLPPDDPAFGG